MIYKIADNEGTFLNLINRLIPEPGMKLAGAVCDFYRTRHRAESIVFSGGVSKSDFNLQKLKADE